MWKNNEQQNIANYLMVIKIYKVSRDISQYADWKLLDLIQNENVMYIQLTPVYRELLKILVIYGCGNVDFNHKNE